MTAPQTGVSRAPRPSSLADVLDLILDKGLVIDAYVRVSAVGIEILTIDARIVIASVDTYLHFAEAVNRLDLRQTETPGLTGFFGDQKDSSSNGSDDSSDGNDGDGKRSAIPARSRRQSGQNGQNGQAQGDNKEQRRGGGNVAQQIVRRGRYG
jgi:hypothetical protein